MAFQIVEQGRLARPSGHSGGVAIPSALRRPVAAGLAVLVTSVMLWALVARLVATADPARRADLSTALKTFTVADPTDPLAANPAPVPKPVLPRPAPLTPSRTPQIASSLPKEWSTTRIRVASAAPAAPATAAPAIASGPPLATGSASSGAAGYDPYAGAIPMRREGPVFANGVASRTAGVDRSMLDTIHAMARARLPGLHGRIMVVVIVTPAGRTASIHPLQTSIGDEGEEILFNLLRTFGKFPSTGKRYRLRLPAFTF